MQRNLDQFRVCAVIVICLVAAHILHDKIRYCQTLFNSYYVTGISVLVLQEYTVLGVFSILESTTEVQQKLEKTKEEKNNTIFLLFRKLPLILFTDCM